MANWHPRYKSADDGPQLGAWLFWIVLALLILATSVTAWAVLAGGAGVYFFFR